MAKSTFFCSPSVIALYLEIIRKFIQTSKPQCLLQLMHIFDGNDNIRICFVITIFVIKTYYQSIAFELKMHISFILNEIIYRY